MTEILTETELEEIYAELPRTLEEPVDPRDYLMSELGGADIGTLPTESSQIYIPILNQGKGNKCSLYGTVGLMNNQNAKEATEVGVDFTIDSPENYLAEAIKRKFDPKWGWFVSSACTMLVELGKITGYVRCPTIDEMKRAVHFHGGFVTSTMGIDWKQTDLQKKMVRGAGGGHIFYCNKYDHEGFWFANSWTEAWGIGGRFLIRYEDLDVLNPSKMAFLDISDAPKLWALKAIRKGITTAPNVESFRPNANCTRYEAAMFVSRALGVLVAKLWNASRPNDAVTAFELATMVARANGEKDPVRGINDAVLPRWQVVKAIYSK